jgi:hypothetical protein
MPASVACPSCRSAVSIPADHAEPTIRCGICWKEVSLGDRPAAAPAPVAAPPVTAPVAVAKRPAPSLPGKPLPGMAKLEDRMQRAAARLAPPPAAPVVAKALPVQPVAKPEEPIVEIAPALATITPAAVRIDPVPAAFAPSAAAFAPDPDDDRPTRPSRSRGSRRRVDHDDDEDDEDDRPRRRNRPAPKGGNPLPLILGIGGAIVLLVGGVYLIARSARGPSDRDVVPLAEANDPPIQFNLPNVDPNPPPLAQPQQPQIGFNPFPNMPNLRPAKPQNPIPKLVAHTGDGYTAMVFPDKRELPTSANLYDDAYIIAIARGKRTFSDTRPPVAAIEITTVDAPQNVTPDLKRIMTEAVFRRGDVKAAKFAGQEGFEHIDEFAGRKTTTRICQVGCRVFLAKFTITGAFGDAQAAEAAQKEFFDSFKITFDANTPAPADRGLVPKKKFEVPRPPMVPAPPKPKLPGQP